MTSSLHDKLQPQRNSIRQCAKDVNEAIALTKAIYDRKAQEFQKQQLGLAAKQRNKLSALAFQSRRDLENIKKWQIQRDQEIISKFCIFPTNL